MKIAVWKTGHEIADTVAQALAEGIPNAEIKDTRFNASDTKEFGAHIAYGILRGTADIFKANQCYIHVDRGYFHPGHYDGYYRISYKGTQAKYDAAFLISKEYDGQLEPKRRYDRSKPVLVCPPTLAVDTFFELGAWIDWLPDNRIMRDKGDTKPIPWDDISAVITFNSSVGWEALRRGIPCLSDPTHSVVGSYYNTKSIDECIELFHSRSRKPLFDLMASHQFTLAEIRKGVACPLIQHYLKKHPSSVTSAGIPENPSPPVSLSTPSGNVPQNRFRYISSSTGN